MLSDASSRKTYDLKGRAGLEKPMVDPGVVFAMMFGDSQFEHLVREPHPHPHRNPTPSPHPHPTPNQVSQLVTATSAFCAYFNSWRASASVNHFHCHLIEELPPVALLPLVPHPRPPHGAPA